MRVWHPRSLLGAWGAVGCLERIIACTVARINEAIWDDSIEKALLVLICSNTTSIETLAENVFTRAKKGIPASRNK
jgi:hypothetical protein